MRQTPTTSVTIITTIILYQVVALLVAVAASSPLQPPSSLRHSRHCHRVAFAIIPRGGDNDDDNYSNIIHGNLPDELDKNAYDDIIGGSNNSYDDIIGIAHDDHAASRGDGESEDENDDDDDDEDDTAVDGAAHHEDDDKGATKEGGVETTSGTSSAQDDTRNKESMLVGIIDLRPNPPQPDCIFHHHHQPTKNGILFQANFPPTPNDSIQRIEGPKNDILLNQQAATSHTIGSLCSTIYIVLSYDFENGKTVLHRSLGGLKLMNFMDGVRNRWDGDDDYTHDDGDTHDAEENAKTKTKTTTTASTTTEPAKKRTKLVILLIPSSTSAASSLPSYLPPPQTSTAAASRDNENSKNNNDIMNVDNKIVIHLNTNTNTNTNNKQHQHFDDDDDTTQLNQHTLSGANLLVTRLKSYFSMGGDKYEGLDPFDANNVELIGVWNMPMVEQEQEEQEEQQHQQHQCQEQQQRSNDDDDGMKNVIIQHLKHHYLSNHHHHHQNATTMDREQFQNLIGHAYKSSGGNDQEQLSFFVE